MNNQLKIGDKVRIKKEWCDSIEERHIVYTVLSLPNSNNRVDIRDDKCEWLINPISSVKIEYIEKA